jgi:hypothetical protein
MTQDVWDLFLGLLEYRRSILVPKDIPKILDRCTYANEEQLHFGLVVHEVLHLSTLNQGPSEFFKGYGWADILISRLPKAEQEENELRVLAAEIVMLRPYGTLKDEDKYLHMWERLFKIPGLRDNVIRLSIEPRATQDGIDAIQFALECQALRLKRAA